MWHKLAQQQDLSPMTREALHINNQIIQPGEVTTLALESAQLYSNSPVHMPVKVFHGKEPGPTLLICAAIHGDEINGIEIIRQVISTVDVNALNGTLIAVPIINQLGFIQRSRYLPDRRDLNRAFPGEETGSLAARIAYRFTETIFKHATHLIDLHTAAIHRTNLPQIRTDISDPENLKMARAFGLPVVLNSEVIEGSLRFEAGRQGKHAITFEGGEALRFNNNAITGGVQGIFNVMAYLKMYQQENPPPQINPTIANSSLWVRANTDGLLMTDIELGAHVEKGDVLGSINVPLEKNPTKVKSPINGIVIGRSTIPLVHQGEALFHIASFKSVSSVIEKINELRTYMENA